MCIDELDSKGKPWNKKLFGIAGSTNRSIEIGFIPCKPQQLTPDNWHK
jgi:hypothetical protein